MDLAFLYKDYKKLLLLPLVLFVAFAFLSLSVPLGIELQGGTLISIQLGEDVSVEGLKDRLNAEFELTSVQVNKVSSPLGTGLLVRFSENPLLVQAEQALSGAVNSSVEEQRSVVEGMTSSLEEFTSIESRREALETSKGSNPLDAGFGLLAEAKNNFNSRLTDFLKSDLGVDEFESISITTIGPSLGEEFSQQALNSLLLAFSLILVVVFLFFRSFIPSIAILLAALFDILAALAGMSLFGIPLTLASITALLMLVGYSVDTDIMLTTRILKRKEGSAVDRTLRAMRTGLTMTGTTFFAVSVLFLVSYLVQMEVVVGIAAVLLFGLVGDVISTWFMNAPMLLWYHDKREKKAIARFT